MGHGEGQSDRRGVLIEEEERDCSAPHSHTQRKSHVRAETNLTRTLTLDSQPPAEPRGYKCPSFKPPHLWCLAMAAQAHNHDVQGIKLYLIVNRHFVGGRTAFSHLTSKGIHVSSTAQLHTCLEQREHGHVWLSL